jgi:hypothetical protein
VRAFFLVFLERERKKVDIVMGKHIIMKNQVFAHDEQRLVKNELQNKDAIYIYMEH